MKERALRVPVARREGAEQGAVDIPAENLNALLKKAGMPKARVLREEVNVLMTCTDGFVLYLSLDNEGVHTLATLSIHMPRTAPGLLSTRLAQAWRPEDADPSYATMAEMTARLDSVGEN